MNKHLRLIYLLLLLFSVSISTNTAQTDFTSEGDLKKQASKLFDQEEYEKAYPLYSQLVSLYRKDPNYNYRLGVCMLFAGTGDDKERSITFLEFAARSSEVEKERLFYLAKAYHLNYRFDEAITQYKAYKKIASSAKAERLQVDRQIEMCKNGKALLHTISDLAVLDKVEMNRADFFRSYDISGIGGKLLVKPDEKEFRTALDKKKNENSIIYLAANNSQIFFSSYGDNDQHGKDIYQMKKLPSGEWGKPETLGKTINTDYDEDYPFLHPNGKVLYFCSKGHNSMGGYDIFKSTFNEDTKTWNEPVNLDFPINTPDDDILYVTDANEKKAYFSSARSSIAGKISVYHINVERKPVDIAYIKGAMVKNRVRESVEVKITVKNLSDNTILGVYNTKPVTGAYEIKLPNGGRFLFSVESTDFPTQSEIVTVPVQTEFKPLKQEISYDLAADKLIIKNSFDEPANDTTYMLAVNFIKEKSKLNVTPVNEISPEVAVTKEEKPTTEESPTQTTQQATATKIDAKLSNDDIVKIAYKDAEDADIEAKEVRQQADIALDLANQKNEQAKVKLQKLNALNATAAKEQDNLKKQALTDEANALSKDAEQLNQETVVTYNLAKKLDMTASSKQEEADLSMEYAKGLEVAVKSPNSTAAIAKMALQEKRLDSLSQVNANHFPIFNSFQKEEEYKKRELDKALQESKDLKGEITDNETIISSLKAGVEKTNSAQEKEGMNNQIAELVQENSNRQKALKQNEIKKAKLQKEYNIIKNETDLVSTVVDQSKTTTGATASAKVAAIDKNKLQEQVNTIQNTSSVKNDTTANITSAGVSTEAFAVAKNDTTSTQKTTAKTYADINKKYETDLTSAEKIKDKDEREKEKADVLKKWSEAIDADVVVEKQDLAKTSDPEMKKELTKKIGEAEKSSKEKQKQAEQSLAKVKKEEKKNIPLAVGLGTTYGNNNNHDTTAIVKNTDLKGNKNIADSLTIANKKNVDTTAGAIKNTSVTGNNSENKTNLTKNGYAYGTSVNEQITNADLYNNQANDIVAQADAIRSQAGKETNVETKKAKIKQSEDLIKDSQKKKLQAVQQITIANKVESQTNQKQLDQLSETYSAYSADELSMAEMNNDEAKIYFDKAQKSRTQADTTNFYLDKETANDNAYKNEMIALEKQKKSINFYKNFNPNAVTTSANTYKSSKTTNEKQSIGSLPATKEQIEKDDSLNKQSVNLTQNANETKLQSSKPIVATDKSKYAANQKQIEQLAKATTNNNSADLLKAEILNDEANKNFNKAKKQIIEADSTKSKNSKDSILEEANKNETIALQKQQESIDIYNKYNPNPVANNLNPEQKTTETIVNTAGTDIGNNSAQTKAVIHPAISEVFEQKTKAVYTTKKPIPINESLPEGLVFKVQIGAFRKPIPQNLFQGISPIMGETTPKGFIRYTAGLFAKYASADKVKKEIVNSGYKDAFVVAFLNGKRIPINQAYAMDIAIPATVLQANNQPEKATQTIVPINNKQSEIVSSSSVSAIAGLFYTVQVGVFSQKVSPAKLFNMDPLYTETAPNGNLRYYSGSYKSVSRATEAKDMINDVGIKDAFVTAYYNGKRITMNEAKQYEKQGDAIFATLPNINKLPVFNSPSPQKQVKSATRNELAADNVIQFGDQSVTDNTEKKQEKIEVQQTKNTLTNPSVNSSISQSETSTIPSTISDDSGIIFKLQIGAFKDEVPLEMANKFIKIASKGIKNYKDSVGLTIYTAGNFRTYDEATQLKTEVKAADLNDTFIVAYRDGKKIGVEEAKKLTKK